jgi:hypothetical protein
MVFILTQLCGSGSSLQDEYRCQCGSRKCCVVPFNIVFLGWFCSFWIRIRIPNSFSNPVANGILILKIDFWLLYSKASKIQQPKYGYFKIWLPIHWDTDNENLPINTGTILKTTKTRLWRKFSLLTKGKCKIQKNLKRKLNILYSTKTFSKNIWSSGTLFSTLKSKQNTH